MITFNHKMISIDIPNPDIKDMYIWHYDELPKNLSGVYVIKSRDGREIYVGESKNIRKRIEQHMGAKDSAEDSYIKAKLSKSYDYKKYFLTMDIYECDGIEREIYEIALINHFKTPFNITSNFHEKKPLKYAIEYEKLNEKKITYSAYEENARNSKAKPEEYILFSTYCNENKIGEGAGIEQAPTFLHFKNQNMEQWVADLMSRFSLTREEILEQALEMSKCVDNIPDINIFADILFDE
ncbi:GIY-YIG nuclease family protein [Peribacillus frigoritolerans]|uniref:GIY-YIG nuclease family protein n=1 Tax=Peribacillus frigoritolerans TaxID=450367 RepID=UPI0032B599A3